MSLRDQLLAKGLVSKKRARQAGREARAERKSKQGNRRRKKQVEREAAAAAAKEKAEATAQRQQERKAREEAKEAHELVYRVRQIVRANRLGAKGPVPFYYRLGSTPVIRCFWLRESLARELRAGRAAIAGFVDDKGEWEHHVITTRAALKLKDIAPEALSHWVEGTEHFKDPAQGLLMRAWEATLGPHRVHDTSELSRLRDRERSRDGELRETS